MALEPITTRTRRLNSIIWEQNIYSKNKHSQNALTRECLLDAFFVLYNECDKDTIKKRDKNIAEFISKFRGVMNETMFLRINKTDFTEKALIGKGYFGNVYLVVENFTGDVYAMKTLKKSVLTSCQVKEERDIMSRRCSEWITNLQYSFQDSDFLYLVMEYLPGGDLYSLMIRNGHFEEESVKFYLAEMNVAINELHNMGFVHRDIKPENILIDRFGHIKLADFGNAAVLNKGGYVISMSPVGTPDYIAPELLQTITSYKIIKGIHDVTCDFWSMGIIAYEMAFETTPFYNENVHDTYTKILTYCEESNKFSSIVFPEDITNFSENFKDLIENLVTKPSKRFSFSKIKNHKFFENVKWDSLRQQLAPFIPNVNGEDDVSNFEDVEKRRGKGNTSTRVASNLTIRSNDFSGRDLPFLGYGFIHEEKPSLDYLNENRDAEIVKLNNKIKEMKIILNNQKKDFTMLKEDLLIAEKKNKEYDITSKILAEVKTGTIKLNDNLTQIKSEFAQCKREKKILESSLKIEKEQRLKTEASVSEVLSSTYKKWEKAKTASEQFYEKQIAEKKTEIINLNEKLIIQDSELDRKCEEIKELTIQVENFKERFQIAKKQGISDKEEFEKTKYRMQEDFDMKLKNVQEKLNLEMEKKKQLTCELRDIRSELENSIQTTNSNLQAKITTEKNINDIKQRLNREIELNNMLRSENSKIEKLKTEFEKNYENLRIEHEKLKEENQLREATKKLSSESAMSSQYQSANGSLSDLHAVEEQLRNDLANAKEGEDKQRNRADHFEKIVKKLEDMLSKMDEQPKCVENVLEKQNEKLEDKLVAVREQMIVERQSARTANLSLWKVEKQVEDLQNEKKKLQRRMELTEEKVKRVQNEKSEVEIQIRELKNNVKEKNNRIEELKTEIQNLKIDVQKEHQAWQKAEEERMLEKSEVLVHINKTHNLEGKVEDLNQKLLQSKSKQDTLTLENKRLLRDLNTERDNGSSSRDLVSELQSKLKESVRNCEKLTVAVKVNDLNLTHVDDLLNAEIRKNKSSQEKIDNLFKNLREKEDIISQLKKDLNLEISKKIEFETKIKDLKTENDELHNNLKQVEKQLISQQSQLIDNTNNLYETQDNLELLLTESNKIQTMNSNFEKEINILKEENSKILTELFYIKEEKNKLNDELKSSKDNISSLEEQIEQQSNYIEEQKNFYLQRDIKSEATLQQHKKLIDYLQLKVEDLLQKTKKKTFADKLFGSATPNNKKENINPNAIETSILYRTLKEEINREKQKNKLLQDQLEKQINNSHVQSRGNSPVHKLQLSSPSKSESQIKSTKVSQVFLDNPELYPVLDNIESEPQVTKTVMHSTQQITKNHRFELNLDSTNTNKNCAVCSALILAGLSHWFCKECKCCVHRKCRGNVKGVCGSMESTIEILTEKDYVNNFSNNSTKTEEINLSSDRESVYNGDFIMSAEIVNPPLEINCAFDLMPNIVLLGTSTGLLAYGLETNTFIKINGIENVQYISASFSLSKVLIAANDGNDLIQCDLRQLQTRSQSIACMKPLLDITKIDLSKFTEMRDQFHLVKISNESEHVILTSAIAVGSQHIIFLKYDANLQNFKPIRYLKSPCAATSILFTRHSAIIGVDKFLKINLCTYETEELIDFSDPTLNHLKNYLPMSIFNISPQEYLVCFEECGIFVDEYGCRSRPHELTWDYIPTGFLYQEPFLYISHYQLVQVIRLHRSYRNEIASSVIRNESPNLKRHYFNLYMATILAKSGNNNCYCLAVNRGSSKQELFLLDGLKALKNIDSVSTESLSSEATCLTTESESIY